MPLLKNLILFLCLAGLFSCAKHKAKKQAEKDKSIITKYIADNNLDASATGSGLYYVIKTQGTGAQPDASSTVTVNYRGYLSDGTVFDQSAITGLSFPLSSVIKGWQEGIPYFKKGGKGILLIPSALGYGTQASGKIPANSVLIFDIELLDVK
ncbi:MAG: FKBP-type peptidyl-prolyl cis-trans isomerase [Bacteroidia bacterium]